MSELAEIQKVFQNYLLDDDDQMSDCIVQRKDTEKDAGLAIYHNAYALRLLDIVADDFPVLRQVMGADAFDDLATNYLADYPSQHFSARYFGERLPAFLQSQKQFAYAEMAQFEWLLEVVVDAVNAPYLTLQQLGQIDPEQWPELTLQLHPAVRLMTCKFNTVAQWQAINNQQPLPSSAKLIEAISVLIWRQPGSLDNYFRVLGSEELGILQGFEKGHDFEAVCEKLAEQFDEEQATAIIVNYLQTWIRDGILLTNQR